MEEIIAISDIGTMLYKKIAPATNFSELMEVTSAPAEGSDAGVIDVTTLKSKKKQSIPDRPEIPVQNFNYNYTQANRILANSVCDGVPHDFLVIYQDGSGYVITGQASTYNTEIGGPGNAVKGVLNIIATATAWKTKAEVDEMIETPSV
jgi:hypothetical protein